jgi:tetratricopeptide (TPR) repeat protein
MALRISSLGSWICLGIIGTLMIGCSLVKTPQHNLLKEYRKKSKIQETLLVREEEKQGKSPELGAEGYERLGDQYLMQGEVDMAFIQYQKALRRDPSRNHIRYKLGHLFLQKELTEEAKREFEEVLKRDGDHPFAQEGIGRIYFKQANWDEAGKSFRRAIELRNNLWQAHHFLAMTYDHQGEPGLATRHYQLAIALKPTSSMLYNNLGVSLLLVDNYEEAVSAFTEALALDNSNKKIHNNLGLALSKLKRYPEAYEAFRRGGDEVSAYYNMGNIYMRDGKYEEAIKAFEKVIEARPKADPAIHKSLERARVAVSIQPPE